MTRDQMVVGKRIVAHFPMDNDCTSGTITDSSDLMPDHFVVIWDDIPRVRFYYDVDLWARNIHEHP
jgi:hypothetical protein